MERQARGQERCRGRGQGWACQDVGRRRRVGWREAQPRRDDSLAGEVPREGRGAFRIKELNIFAVATKKLRLDHFVPQCVLLLSVEYCQGVKVHIITYDY